MTNEHDIGTKWCSIEDLGKMLKGYNLKLKNVPNNVFYWNYGFPSFKSLNLGISKLSFFCEKRHFVLGCMGITKHTLWKVLFPQMVQAMMNPMWVHNCLMFQF